jgi:hypothetical protein
MTTPHPRFSSPIGAAHPAVLDRRIRELFLLGMSALVPAVLAMAVTVEVPRPNYLLDFGVIAGGLGIVMLVLNSRLEVTVTLVVLYVGLLEGPVKLLSGGHEAASVVRDVLIFAVSLGAVLRLLVKRERIKLPPLSAWVLAFVAFVLVEALNPNTVGLVKVLGGYRQQLEWVPFFFFGYAIMRSKKRFRKFFIILGVLALANGLVSTYQAKLTPAQLASWGPGYKELVFGTIVAGSKGGVSGRGYITNGVARVRPPALGTDSGFGGGLGLIALPCALALFATGDPRRRWIGALLCLGALLGLVTGLGRLQVVGALVGTLAFALLSAGAGRQVTRPLLAILGVVVLAVPLGALLVSVEAPGTFSRYASIAPGSVAGAKDKKVESLTNVPSHLIADPFGIGLGRTGPAAGFGGRAEQVAGYQASVETQYTAEAAELGAPGLFLWIGLSIAVLLLAVRRLKSIGDIELRLYLAGVFAVLVSFLLAGASGPIMDSAACAPFFWFAVGIAAYWFAGPNRMASSIPTGAA